MKPPPVQTAAECVARLRALGHTFRLDAAGGVEVRHPIALPPGSTEELDAITAFLSRRWEEVMREVRRQILTPTGDGSAG